MQYWKTKLNNLHERFVKSRCLAQVGLGSSNQTKAKSMKLLKVLQCIMASLELPWTGEAPFLVLRTGDSLVATTRLPLLLYICAPLCHFGIIKQQEHVSC